MIRINLLATERRQAKAAPKGLLLAQKMTVIGSLIVVLAALGLGWRYWAVEQEKATVERQLAVRVTHVGAKVVPVQLEQLVANYFP